MFTLPHFHPPSKFAIKHEVKIKFVYYPKSQSQVHRFPDIFKSFKNVFRYKSGLEPVDGFINTFSSWLFLTSTLRFFAWPIFLKMSAESLITLVLVMHTWTSGYCTPYEINLLTYSELSVICHTCKTVEPRILSPRPEKVMFLNLNGKSPDISRVKSLSLGRSICNKVSRFVGH